MWRCARGSCNYTTRLRFDGRSTAFSKVTKVTMTRPVIAAVTLTYLLIYLFRPQCTSPHTGRRPGGRKIRTCTFNGRIAVELQSNRSRIVVVTTALLPVKLFRTKSIDVDKDCQYFFGAVLPIVLDLRKSDKLALRYICINVQKTPFAHVVALYRVLKDSVDFFYILTVYLC